MIFCGQIYKNMQYDITSKNKNIFIYNSSDLCGLPQYHKILQLFVIFKSEAFIIDNSKVIIKYIFFYYYCLANVVKNY